MMRNDHSFPANLVTILLLILFTHLAFAQEDPAFSAYNLKKLSWKNSTNWSTIASWRVTGKKTSHLVVITSDEAGDGEFWLTQHKLTDKGELSQYGKSMFIGLHYVLGCGSVWLESGSSSPSAVDPGGTALIFIPAIRDYSRKGFDLFAVGLRPSDGAEVITKKAVFSHTAHSKILIYRSGVKAVRGSSSIGVLFTLNYLKPVESRGPYPYSSRLYFLETDFSGKPLGAAKEIKLPDNGIDRWYMPADIKPNGSAWIAAVYESRFQTVIAPSEKFSIPQDFHHLGSGLRILTTRGKTYKKIKFKFKKLFSENQDQEYYTYHNARFLPMEDSATVEGSRTGAAVDVIHNLFFSHWIMIDKSDQKLDRFIPQYGLVPINGKGKKAGSITKVEIPQWTHGLTYDPDSHIYFNGDQISNFVQEQSGDFYMSQTRYLTTESRFGYGFTWEQEFNLYIFDRHSGNVTLLSRSIRNWPGIPFAQRLRFMGSKTAVINQMQEFPGGKFDNYWSVFKR